MTKKSSELFILMILWMPAVLLYAYLPADIKVLYFIRIICSLCIIIKHIMTLKTIKPLYMILWYGGCLLLSEVMNLYQYIDYIDCLVTIEYVLYLLAMFLYVSKFNDKEWKYFFVNVKYISCVYIILNLLFTIPKVGSDIEALGVIFFIGSRADSVQYFVVLIALMVIGDWIYKNKIQILTLILSSLCILMTFLYHSGQGIVTFLVVIILEILFFKRNMFMKKVLSPLKVMMGTIILNIIIVSQVYKKITLFVWLITKVLKKSLSITGRDMIYASLPNLYIKSPIWGFGYRNDVVKDALSSISAGWNSAHNSLGIVLFNAGIMGIIPFLLILWYILSRLAKKWTRESILIYSTIIGLMVSGIISGALGGTAYWFLGAVAFSYVKNPRFYTDKHSYIN